MNHSELQVHLKYHPAMLLGKRATEVQRQRARFELAATSVLKLEREAGIKRKVV